MEPRNLLRNDVIRVQYTLFHVFSFLKRKADNTFKLHGVTGAQVGVLSRLSLHEGKQMNKLSEELWCDVSNITGVIDRLEKQQLVIRSAHPKDRRITHIFLTVKGQKTLNEVLPEHEQYLIEKIGQLSAEEREILVKLLEKILK